LIEWLYQIDLDLFRLCNETLVHSSGDFLFPFITEIRNFYIPYAIILMALLLFGKKKGIITVLLLILTVTVSDQLSSSLLKPFFDRIRPCSDLTDVRLLVGCGGGKSFPSSHATNSFAIAFLISGFYRKAAPYIFIYAALVAYSRVYVGVHYPSDILFGAILGSAVGLLMLFAYKRTMSVIKKKPAFGRKTELHDNKTE